MLLVCLANQLDFAYISSMGYVFSANDAHNYQKWLADEGNKVVLGLETRLMTSLLRPVCGDSLLDVGCGTGESIKPFLGKGINLTGIDPSPHMLEIARQSLGHRVDFHRGYAEDLPFQDNAFNYVSLFLTLEFANDPEEAIAEACRVAKDSVFIGILNKHSTYVSRLRVSRFFKDSIYRHVRFFSIEEIRQILINHIGHVPFSWKTVLQFPGSSRRFLYWLEAAGYLEKSPFGAFAGIRVLPVPKLQAMPITLKARMEQTTSSRNRVASCSEYQQDKIKAGKR